MIKRPLPMSIPLPSDFSSASSSTSPLSISSKNVQHRFDPTSFLHSNFYELAAVAAAHAAAQAAAYHNNSNKSTVVLNNTNENFEHNLSTISTTTTTTTTTTNSYSTVQDLASSRTTQAAV